MDGSGRTRRLVALVAALIGGYLLTVAADPDTGAGPAFFGLIAGTVLLGLTLIVLQRSNRPRHLTSSMAMVTTISRTHPPFPRESARPPRCPKGSRSVREDPGPAEHHRKSV